MVNAVHVWWCPEWASWGVTYFDADGDTPLESWWYHHKASAKADTPAYAAHVKDELGLTMTPTIEIFTKRGTS